MRKRQIEFDTLPDEFLLREAEAAEMACVSIHTLRNWRNMGRNCGTRPEYERHGFYIRYKVRALRKWLAEERDRGRVIEAKLSARRKEKAKRIERARAQARAEAERLRKARDERIAEQFEKLTAR